MSRLYLFSAVRGVVVRHGQPVPAAVVEREYYWHLKDRHVVEDTLTNANGEFEFTEALGSSFWGRLMPHEPNVRQTLQIKHDGQTYLAWACYRSNYEPLSELDGQPISLLCDLDAPRSNKGPDNRVFGICALR